MKVLKILVVDDNREGCDTMTTYFKTLKHLTESAYCGKDAIIKAVEFVPDFILLDIGMPDLNGWEVSQAIRKHNHLKPTKIYALTGYGDDEDIQHSFESGMNWHFIKPMDYEALWNVLRKHGLL